MEFNLVMSDPQPTLVQCHAYFSEKVCSGLAGKNTNGTGSEGEYGDSLLIRCVAGYFTPLNETEFTTNCTDQGLWSPDPHCYGNDFRLK